MRLSVLPAVSIFLASCATTQSSDPSLLSFKIPKGSTLALNKDLEIPEYKTHATLQSGKLTTDRTMNDYQLNCRIDVKKFGPRTITPEVFRIRRSENGQEWISDKTGLMRYYTDIYLDSEKDTDVIKLTCQTQGDTSTRTFSVSDMETALGDYFTFAFSTIDTPRP